MGSSEYWWSYLHFHIPNYALSLVFYCLFGRFLLSFFLPPNTRNYIYRSFYWLTEWVVRPVAFITPRAMPPVLLPPIAAFWIIVLRFGFYALMFSWGQVPRAQGG
jgi:hypothetical protein